MALAMCTADTFTLIAKALVFLVKNWGWTLSIVLIAILLRKIPLGIEGLALLDDLFADGLATLFTATGFLAIFAGAGAVLFYVILGVLYIFLALTSKANMVLKILSVPGTFIFGIFMGFVPWVSAPISVGYGFFSKQDKLIANIVCLIPSVLLVLAIIFFPDFFCNRITDLVTLLS